MSDRPSSWVDRDDLASNMRWGWRTVRPDFRSRNGYRWPFPGGWAEAPGPVLDHTGPCPEHVGDGLCVALDWSGAALGGISARNPVLVVGWHPDDELGRDPSKVRIRRGYVADVWSAERILHNAPGANLGGANLVGANLGGADLGGADLGGAYLGGADLGGADLGEAYLGGADLAGAYLGEAYLTRAYLVGADLGGANLGGAYLSGANLTGAYLGGANLGGADLGEAYLGGANLGGAVAVPDKVAARLSPSGVHP